MPQLDILEYQIWFFYVIFTVFPLYFIQYIRLLYINIHLYFSYLNDFLSNKYSKNSLFTHNFHNMLTEYSQTMSNRSFMWTSVKIVIGKL